MANILQVTNSALNTETKNIGAEQPLKTPLSDQQIRNPSDPSRVVRADGQESGKSGTATGEKNFGVAGYSSNYGAFLQKLAEGTDLTQLLGDLFSGSGIAAQGDEQTGLLIRELLTSLQFERPEDVTGFLKEQTSQQLKFSGPFFEKFRSLLLQGSSSSMKDAAMEFLRAYNDFSAGEHLLRQMETLTKDITSLLFPSVRGEFEELLKGMDWGAQNGRTQENMETLRGQVIPFLSRYISKTHDYGAVRSATMMLVLNCIKYENGSREQLLQLFDRMASSREFPRFFGDDPKAALTMLLEGVTPGQHQSGFADAFSSLLLKGMEGGAGLEQVQPFYQLLNSLLLNESVYLPLMHLILPFQYQDKEVMSELWVDPDAHKEEDEAQGGRKIRFLVRFEISGVGDFELAASLQERKAKLQLAVPPALMEERQEIQKKVTGIFRQNGMEVSRLLVQEKQGEMRLEEVFPDILRKEKAIDVRI